MNEHIQRTGSSIECLVKCNLFCAKCSVNCMQSQLLKLNIFGMHLESMDAQELFANVLKSFAFGIINLKNKKIQLKTLKIYL